MADSNEERADIGEATVIAFAEVGFFSNPADARKPQEIEWNREDIISDMLASIAHYCRRYGIDPAERFEHGLESFGLDNDPKEIGGFKPCKVLRKRKGAR